MRVVKSSLNEDMEFEEYEEEEKVEWVKELFEFLYLNEMNK